MAVPSSACNTADPAGGGRIQAQGRRSPKTKPAGPFGPRAFFMPNGNFQIMLDWRIFSCYFIADRQSVGQFMATTPKTPSGKERDP
jgi:hypothetical protein